MSAGIIEQLLELLPVAPEPNCSCHLSPPCGDCVDWSHQRHVEAEARAFLAANAKPSLPAFDPSKPSTEQKLYHKFGVYRIDGSPKHQDCEYFVLDLTHDPHARPALAAYATATERTHPLLASDLRERYGLAAKGDDDKVLWGIVANAGRLSSKRQPRWAHVVDAAGRGSNSSAELCRRFGFDPDEQVGGDALANQEREAAGNG